VYEDAAQREPTVGFFRSDPEHHTFAVFRCPQTRPDHERAPQFAEIGADIQLGPKPA